MISTYLFWFVTYALAFGAGLTLGRLSRYHSSIQSQTVRGNGNFVNQSNAKVSGNMVGGDYVVSGKDNKPATKCEYCGSHT